MVYVMNEFFNENDLREIIDFLSLQTERHRNLLKKCFEFCLLTDKKEIVDEYQDFYDIDIRQNHVINLRKGWL